MKEKAKAFFDNVKRLPGKTRGLFRSIRFPSAKETGTMSAILIGAATVLAAAVTAYDLCASSLVGMIIR